MSQPTTYQEWIAIAQSFERDAEEARRVKNWELADFYHEQSLKARLKAQALLVVTK